ncbi:MAG TPA: tRNA (cytidine(34)-2'-O)-methyltransferase [Pirellulales bacterium]|nr:tRNA (cytidine(34)-2'-O)-methyltransferase [Pirellulales bacterium]
MTILKWPAMPEAPKYRPALHVVLYQPEIPHNTGSVGRTCVATGTKLWLVEPLGFRLDDYYLRRAGLDYWPELEWEVVPDWPALAERLAGGRFWFFSKSGRRNYQQVAFEGGDVLVFGNESQGLPESLRQLAGENLLGIPIRPQVRSLNLSNAVAIVLYEGVRQGIVPIGGGPGVLPELGN